MFLISSLLFGFSASIDSFIVGMTYGVKKMHISSCKNLIISTITLAGTVLSILAGSRIAPFLPERAAKAAGSMILILLGIYYIVKFILIYFKKRRTANSLSANALSYSAASGRPDTGLLTGREAAALGLALSVNNIGIGLGASISGIRLASTAAVTFFLSILLLALGNRLGRLPFLQFAGRFADPLAGLILIALGLYEWIA